MNPATRNIVLDKVLINSVLSGDAGAFKVLVAGTERLVAQIVYKMIGNAEDRKDLVQEVYLKVFKSLPDFRYQAKLSTWIGQIAYNTCITHLGKRKLVLGLDHMVAGNGVEEDHQGEGLDGGRPHDLIESRLLERERSVILHAAIEKLSPVYKTLIALYHMEDLSYGEISEIMELPEGTVKSYLHRARKALRDGLQRHYKKEEL